MKFTLIICTYMRPNPLLKLLQSVQAQTLYPYEIIIVDGSVNQETKEMLERNSFENLHYFLIAEKDRGLTRQRNYGIARAGKEMDIICFLDDDTVLEPALRSLPTSKHPSSMKINYIYQKNHYL